jgi:HSP20 family protein
MANSGKTDDRRVSRASTPGLWDPFRIMDMLLRWGPFGSQMSRSTLGAGEFNPRFDATELETGYVIRGDLPGVKEEDVEVSLAGNLLTISGRRDEEQSSEGRPYLAIERAQGSFARTLSLPDDVDSEGLTADLEDGVLTVRVPKRPEAQAKKIQIGKRSRSHGKTK